MDLRKLKTLIELVESSGIAELEIQEGEERVRITRTTASGATGRALHSRCFGIAAPILRRWDFARRRVHRAVRRGLEL